MIATLAGRPQCCDFTSPATASALPGRQAHPADPATTDWPTALDTCPEAWASHEWPKAMPRDGGSEVAEIAGDLRRSLAGYVGWAVRAWRKTLAEVEKQQAGYVPPDTRDDLTALREHIHFALTAFEPRGRSVTIAPQLVEKVRAMR